jgi:hypothetical protein
MYFRNTVLVDGKFLALSLFDSLRYHAACRHHTDCGMLTFNDELIRAKLKEERNGADASHIAFQHFHGAAFSDLSALIL